jgi:hypothetical protein
MVWVSLTRLRVRSVWFMPRFFWYAQQSQKQVERAEGFLLGGLLADRERTFWTMTLWESRAAMLGYMTSGAHKKAMPKLMDWCDEASVAGWEQDEAVMPRWEEADRRMRAQGRVATVHRPSAAQVRSAATGMEYSEIRTTGAVGIRRQ